MDTVRRNTTDVDMNIDVKKISWGAIFAGALIMLVIMMLLSLLGFGIGIGSINPATEDQPMEGLGIGAMIWWVLSNFIAIFVGGYIAGKLTTATFNGSGLIHGILSWSVYTLISFFILTTTVGAVFSGVGSVLTKSVSGVGSGIGKIVEGAQNQGLNIQGVIDKTVGDQVNKEQLMNVLKDVFIKNGKLNKNISQQEVENAIVNNTKLNEEQVKQLSNEVYKVYQEGLSKWEDVKVGIEKANHAASKAAIWSFVALVIGAGFGATGGKVGERKEEHTNERRL